MKYLNQENITLSLSIFGTLGTLITWYSNWKNSRKNIVLKTSCFTRTKNLLIVYMIINNNSSESIIINGIALNLNNALYHCYDLPKKLLTTSNSKGGVITESKDFYSIAFPINLSSTYGTSGYFAFDVPQEELKTLSTHANLLVSSNRGKAFEIQLKLENEVLWNEMF